MFREVWDREFENLTKLAESHRREPCANPAVDLTTRPTTIAEIQQFCDEVGGEMSDEEKRVLQSRILVDYAEAVTAITVAMSHLQEAIPNRQLNRIRAAFALLKMGSRALGMILESRNVI